MKQLMLLIFLSWFHVARSQSQYTIQQAEDSLAVWSSVFLVINVDSAKKQEQLDKFKQTLADILATQEGRNHSFSKLSSISILSPPDESFRIFTWFTTSASGYKAHGLIQINKQVARKHSPVVHLTALTHIPKGFVYKTLDAENWPGMVYYNLIPVKSRNESYYLLLGFHGNDGLTHKKSIDVISITSSGQVRFGLPVFMNENRMANRIVFEYKANARMSLRYYEKNKMFIFDHLSPENPSMKGQFQHYMPDFSYDAFKYEKKKWIYIPDVYTKNESENSGKPGVKYNLELPDK